MLPSTTTDRTVSPDVLIVPDSTTILDMPTDWLISAENSTSNAVVDLFKNFNIHDESRMFWPKN